MRRRSLHLSWLFLLALLPACDRATVREQEEEGPTTTTPLTLVPTPRRVKREPDQFLGRAALVVPILISDRVQIATDEINQRIQELGGEFLPVFRADTTEERSFPGRLIQLSLVDTRDREENERVPAHEQGYAIDSLGRIVRLVGRDEQGLLWAAVTLRRMLTLDDEGRILLMSAEVRDWPDFAVRMMGRFHKYARRHTERELLKTIREKNTADADRFAAEYVEDSLRNVDFLFRLKHNLTWFPIYGVPTRMDRLIEAIGSKEKADMFLECLSRVTRYARERGIEVASVQSTHVGTSPEDDDDAEISRCVRHRSHRKYFCWTLDVHNRLKAEEVAKFFAQARFSLVALHNVDGGGVEDPANWGQRCRSCRERWEDDRAGADGHLYATWHEAFRGLAPETSLTAIQYPYDASVLLRQNEPLHIAVRDYWVALHKQLPREEKFSVCVREGTRPAIAAFAEVFPTRPLLVYWMTDTIPRDHRWGPLFSSRIRYARTFLLEGRRDWLFGYSSGCRPLAAVAGAQYMWDTDTPGSALWPGPLDVDRDGEQPTAFFREQLPAFVSELFGPEAAKDMLETFQGCISPSYCLAPVAVARMCRVRNTVARMRQQYDALVRATGGLERVWQRLEAGEEGVLAADRVHYLNGLSEQTGRARMWASYHLARMEAVYAYRRGETEERIATDLGKAIERVEFDIDFTRRMLGRIRGELRFGQADLNRWVRSRIEERYYRTSADTLMQNLTRLQMVFRGRTVELVESDANAGTVRTLLPDRSGKVECTGKGAMVAGMVDLPTQSGSGLVLQLDGLTEAWKDGAAITFPAVNVSAWRQKPSVLRFYVNGGGAGHQNLTFWLYARSNGRTSKEDQEDWPHVALSDYVDIDGLDATRQLVSIPLEKLLKPGFDTIIGFGVNNAVVGEVCGPVWIDTMYVAEAAEPVEREVALRRSPEPGPAREAEIHVVSIQPTTFAGAEGTESRLMFGLKLTGDGTLTEANVSVRVSTLDGRALAQEQVFEAVRLRTPWWSPSLRYDLGAYLQDATLEVTLESREVNRTITRTIRW